jgi:hypothetical protein
MHIISTQEESPTDGERHVVFVAALSGAGSEPVGHHPGLPIGHSRRRSALLPCAHWAGTLDVPVSGYYVYGPGARLWLGLAMLVTMPLGAPGGCGEPGAPGAPASRSTPAATRSTRRSCSRPPPACAAVRSCHPRVAGRCPPKVVAGVLGHANISITSTPTATRSRPCRSRRRRPSPAWCSAPDAPCGQTVSIRPTSAPHE